MPTSRRSVATPRSCGVFRVATILVVSAHQAQRRGRLFWIPFCGLRTESDATFGRNTRGCNKAIVLEVEEKAGKRDEAETRYAKPMLGA